MPRALLRGALAGASGLLAHFLFGAGNGVSFVIGMAVGFTARRFDVIDRKHASSKPHATGPNGL